MGAGGAFDCCGQHQDLEASNFVFANVGRAEFSMDVMSHGVYMEAGSITL